MLDPNASDAVALEQNAAPQTRLATLRTFIKAFCLRPYSVQVTRQVLLYGILLAICLRCSLLYHESLDYTRHLTHWYDNFAKNGGLAAIQSDFSNYTPAYQYWLATAATGLKFIPKVISIKLLAILFDFICAYFVYKIVQLKYPTGSRALASFLVVLLTPTVFLNSAFWGQCDSIYTTGLVACVYYLCLQKDWLAMLSFGFGFAFKLQAIFLAPFLLIMFFQRKIHWLAPLLIPMVYILFAIPAWIAGRPFSELLLIYANQTNQYRHLTAHAPTIYKLFPFHDQLYYLWFFLGLSIAVLMILYLIYRSHISPVQLVPKRILTLALLSVLVIPFFLPKMHERYFFPADILSIPFGFYFPKLYWVTITIELASFFSYFPRLFRAEIVPVLLLSILLGRTVWILLRHFRKTFPVPAVNIH